MIRPRLVEVRCVHAAYAGADRIDILRCLEVSPASRDSTFSAWTSSSCTHSESRPRETRLLERSLAYSSLAPDLARDSAIMLGV